MGDIQRDVSREFLVCQYIVDEAKVGRRHRDFEVPLSEEVIEAELLIRERVRRAHDADHAVAEHDLRADRARMFQAHANGDVNLFEPSVPLVGVSLTCAAAALSSVMSGPGFDSR